MGARQGPSRGSVIEGCGAPVRRVMADLALLRESGRGVVRVVCILKILQMATDTFGRAQVVIPVGVALRALHLQVRPGEREGSLRMIERSRLPGRCRVANIALLRDAGSDVVWIRRRLKILEMTGDACGRTQVEVAVGMALIALQLCVSTRQRKAYRIVIEAGGLPCGRRVAVLACLRQAQRNVIWITGFLKVRQVAAYAGCGRPRVFPSRMASRAIQRGMHSGKSKTR